MKYIVLIPDGMADWKIPILGDKTPLEAAQTDWLDKLCRVSSTGQIQTIPSGMPAGSEIANLSILGYDPGSVYQGRGVLEAASMGIEILEPRHNEDWNANVLYSYTALSGDDTDLTKVEDTASAAVGMMSAGIAWVDSLVLRAEGSAIVFPWMNSPIYLGDVYASEVRYSAKKKRADNKGVVMLVENPF